MSTNKGIKVVADVVSSFGVSKFERQNGNRTVDLRKKQIQTRSLPIKEEVLSPGIVEDIHFERESNDVLDSSDSAVGELKFHELETFWQEPKIQPPRFSLEQKTIPNSELVRADYVRSQVKQGDPILHHRDEYFYRVVDDQNSKSDGLAWHQMSFKSSSKKIGVLAWTVLGLILITVSAGGLVAFTAVTKGQQLAQHEVLNSGSNAIINLEAAKEDLLAFRFQEAANHFVQSERDFTRATGIIDDFTASIYSLLNDLPQFKEAESATNVLRAGRYFANAGESAALAMYDLSQLNPFFYFDTSGHGQSAAPAIRDFKSSMSSAGADIRKANSLLSDIEIEVIPADKREVFNQFAAKIPELLDYIENINSYADFILSIIGEGGSKSYLVIFANNSELRAGGGFIGSYALATFNDGSLEKFFLDDIYNIDGQNRENIVPPKPLQHITASWGMRDANWFSDFPTSAQKIQEFYQNDGGMDVDGVLVVTPTILQRLLLITGPIDMPDYEVTLDSDNVVAQLQDEIEYKADRAQPKRILIDFQPKLMQAISKLPNDKWLEVFNVLSNGLKEKQILVSFDDQRNQLLMSQNNYAGELALPKSDYLQVTFSNVKGFKTDAFTQNEFDLNIEVSDTMIDHELSITRTNNGDGGNLKFYNRTNSSYVRVYVPKGAILESVRGFSRTNYKSLVNHEDLGFKADETLSRIENTIYHPFSDVDVFEESGKTVIGFWLNVDLKSSKTVTLKYSVPKAIVKDKGYELLWQKQAGTLADPLSIVLKYVDDRAVVSYDPRVTIRNNTLYYESDLRYDRSLKAGFK